MDFSLVYTDKSNFLVLHFCSYSAFYLLICSTCTDVNGDVNDVIIHLIFLKGCFGCYIRCRHTIFDVV